jgi:hypothetical protein
MLLAVAALLGLVLPIQSAHADPDASIRQLTGQVQIRPVGDKKYTEAEAGYPLDYGDQIKTGPKSMAQVEMPNGTVILVKENSFFMIGGDLAKSWVSFQYGEFLIGLKRALTPNESFIVRTPSAVAAVRGTLFWGFSDSKKNSVWASFGHSVSITAQKKTVTLQPGQTVKVAYGSPPEDVQPSTVSASYLQTFAIDNDILGLDKLLDPSIH